MANMKNRITKDDPGYAQLLYQSRHGTGVLCLGNVVYLKTTDNEGTIFVATGYQPRGGFLDIYGTSSVAPPVRKSEDNPVPPARPESEPEGALMTAILSDVEAEGEVEEATPDKPKPTRQTPAKKA